MRKIKKKNLVLISLILLGVLSCQYDDTSQPENNQPIGSIPEELVGVWIDSWSLYMNYDFDPLLYNPVSNKWFSGALDPWSMVPVPGLGIEFKENGGFVHTMVVSTSTGGCQVYTAQYIKGIVNGSSLDQITFKPQVRRMKHHSVCNPSMDFDRNESTGNYTITIEISETLNNAGQEINELKMTDEHGAFLKYYKLIQ